MAISVQRRHLLHRCHLPLNCMAINRLKFLTVGKWMGRWHLLHRIRNLKCRFIVVRLISDGPRPHRRLQATYSPTRTPYIFRSLRFYCNRNECRCTLAQTNNEKIPDEISVQRVRWATHGKLCTPYLDMVVGCVRVASLTLTGQLINGVCRRVRRWKIFVHFSCSRRRCHHSCWSSFSSTMHAFFAITVIIANSFGTMRIIIMRVEMMWHANTSLSLPCDGLKSINSSKTTHEVCSLYSEFAQSSH